MRRATSKVINSGDDSGSKPDGGRPSSSFYNGGSRKNAQVLFQREDSLIAGEWLSLSKYQLAELKEPALVTNGSVNYIGFIQTNAIWAKL